MLASRKVELLLHDVLVETKAKDIDVTIATTVSTSLLSILSAPLLADQRLSTPSMNSNKKGAHTNSPNDSSDKLSNLLQKRDAYKRTASLLKKEKERTFETFHVHRSLPSCTNPRPIKGISAGNTHARSFLLDESYAGGTRKSQEGLLHTPRLFGQALGEISFFRCFMFVCYIDLIDLRQFATVMKAAFVGSLDGRQTSAILLYFYLLLYFISFPVYCLILCTA